MSHAGVLHMNLGSVVEKCEIIEQASELKISENQTKKKRSKKNSNLKSHLALQSHLEEDNR